MPLKIKLLFDCIKQKIAYNEVNGEIFDSFDKLLMRKKLQSVLSDDSVCFRIKALTILSNNPQRFT